MFSKIIATGSFVPDTVVTNDDLAGIMDTSDEWIRTRTGIRERHVFSAEDRERTITAALKACEQALERASKKGLEREEIELVIAATSTPDYMFPATACVLTDRLHIGPAAAFDISLACTGFLAAFSTAAAYLGSGMYKHALIVGVDVMSKLMDPNDRSTSILFGDGAGAVVLSADERFREVAESGLIRSMLKSDGSRSQVLSCEALYGGLGLSEAAGKAALAASDSADAEAFPDKDKGPSLSFEDGRTGPGISGSVASCGAGPYKAPEKAEGTGEGPEPGRIYMNGRAVFEFAVREVPKLIATLLSEAGEGAEPKYYVLHQANYRIIEAVAKRLKAPMDKFPCNIEHYANTTAATIPMLLDELSEGGRLKDGDLIVMSGFGAGLSLGAMLFRW